MQTLHRTENTDFVMFNKRTSSIKIVPSEVPKALQALSIQSVIQNSMFRLMTLHIPKENYCHEDTF